jgi:hypothetical protein
MAEGDNHNVDWSSYDQIFREDAHQLLAWGYQDSRHLITSDREETEITGFIAEAIQNRLNFPTDERYWRYNVKEDNPVSGEGRTGKRRRKIDIIVEDSCSRPRSWYVFEAKRLRRASHNISIYMGEDGMMRFIEGRYAPANKEVAMIGYVQTDTAAHWVKELETHFAEDSENQLLVVNKLSKVSIHPDIQDEWASSHNRTTGSPLTIFHLFLNCCSASTL